MGQPGLPGGGAGVASARVAASAWARGGHVSSVGKPAGVPAPLPSACGAMGEAPRTLRTLRTLGDGEQGRVPGQPRQARVDGPVWAFAPSRPLTLSRAFLRTQLCLPILPPPPRPRPPASAFLRDSCCNWIGSPAASSLHVVCVLRGHLRAVQSMAAGQDAGHWHGKPAFKAGVSSPSVFSLGPVASSYKTAPPLSTHPSPHREQPRVSG